MIAKKSKKIGWNIIVADIICLILISVYILARFLFNIENDWVSVLLAASIVVLVCVTLKTIMFAYRIERMITRFEENEIRFEELINEMKSNHIKKFLLSIKDNCNKGYITNILNKQAEINYLQMQINPHFLYNSLESIRGNALINGEDGIAEMTEALATFFRYSISQKGNMVTLEEEIDNIKSYFIIQQYRFNNKFAINYSLDEAETVLSEYYIPKLTIQPIVENAIHHGLETKVGKGEITIRIEIAIQRLIINIIDDGIGIPQEKLDEINKMLSSSKTVTKNDTGIALYNVNKRIRLNFGENYGLYIVSTVNFGTDVEITLPLINSKNVHQYEEK